MDKWFHPTLYQACDSLSMLGSKLNHVSKRAPGLMPVVTHAKYSTEYFILYMCWQRLNIRGLSSMIFEIVPTTPNYNTHTVKTITGQTTAVSVFLSHVTSIFSLSFMSWSQTEDNTFHWCDAAFHSNMAAFWACLGLMARISQHWPVHSFITSRRSVGCMTHHNWFPIS